MKMFKRLSIFIGCMVLYLMPVIAFAQEVASTSAKDSLLESLLGLAAVALVAILGWVGKLIGKFVNAKIQDLDNDMLQKAAYVAVRWVDDKFKDATGAEKFKLAVEKIAKKIPGVDKDDIEEAVAAMYKNFSGEIAKNE